MKLESLKPGMVVYDVGTYRMGNTTMRSVGVWPVRIVEIDMEKRIVVASWNGNPPKRFVSSEATRWRKNEPLIIRSPMGRARLATREEIKAAKEAKGKP